VFFRGGLRLAIFRRPAFRYAFSMNTRFAITLAVSFFIATGAVAAPIPDVRSTLRASVSLFPGDAA
jgi:hypothetical protein